MAKTPAGLAQVLDQSALTRFGILMVTDVLFAATSYAFIIVGEIFGTERSQGRPVVPYPGDIPSCSTNPLLNKY